MKYITLSLAIALGLAAVAAQAPEPQQPSSIATTITSGSGGPPRLAVPAFLALSNDPDTIAAAKTITDVLWDDLNYEHEFGFVERDVYTTIPAAKSVDDLPFDRWREVNADGVIAGSVLKSGTGFQIKYRLFKIATRRTVLGAEYSGSAKSAPYAPSNPRENCFAPRQPHVLVRTQHATVQ